MKPKPVNRSLSYQTKGNSGDHQGPYPPTAGHAPVLGGTSGPDSYNASAEAKAAFLNEFVRARDVRSVIEFGCSDGNQLSLADYPSYIGLDVSRTAIELC
jgi:hypothetical protein